LAGLSLAIVPIQGHFATELFSRFPAIDWPGFLLQRAILAVIIDLMSPLHEMSISARSGIGLFSSSVQVLLIFSVVLSVASAGCSTARIKKQGRGLDAILTQPTPPEPASVMAEKQSDAPVQASDEALSGSSDGEAAEENRVPVGSITIEHNELVEKWIRYFSEKDRERFQRFLDRGAQYREVVENILEENGLPKELYFLAMIESGYRSEATSIAKAAGVWQFIPATGRRYGLQVDHYADERRDPIRATEAAVKYLTDLYNVFGSWHLAMAAYNAGEYRIVGAVVRGKSRDFWKLAEKKVLPAETLNYVPKFLAAMTIGRDLEKFGFDESGSERYPDLEAVEVPAPVRLSDIAKAVGIPFSELKRVNPHLPRDMTPPGATSYEIWLPENLAKNSATVESIRSALASKKIHGLRRVAATAEASRYHRVRAGENLGRIARKYRMSVSYLKRLNGLNSNRVISGQTLRVAAKSYHPKPVKSARGLASGSSKAKKIRYRVRPGDNLTAIARRFGTSVEELKRMNSMKRNHVLAGQTIRVPSRL